MNEQSINNIIAYIQQYPDVPTEVLVKNILKTGYKMEDLMEALRRAGISPIVIPGYVEPEPPPPKPLFSRTPVIIAAVIIILLLVVGSGFVLLGPNKESAPETADKTQQTVIPETTNTPTSVPKTPTLEPTIPPASKSATTADPFTVFKETFNSADYKVKVDSTEITKATPDFPASTSYDSATAYTKRGALMRLEEAAGTSIYKDNLIYKLDPAKKTYSVISNAAAPKPFSFIPTIIIREAENQRISWEKQSNSEWKGVWWPNPTSSSYTTITIVLDEKTNLLTSISAESIATSSMDDIKLQYEKVPDIDTYITLPEGYTEKK